MSGRELGEVLGDYRRQGESPLCILDRGLETLGETRAPEALTELVPAADAAGHGPGERALPWNLAQSARLCFAEIPRIRRTAARIETEELLLALDPDDREQIAADAIHRRLRQP